MRKRKKKRGTSDDSGQLTIALFADAKSSSSRITKRIQSSDFATETVEGTEIDMEEEEEEQECSIRRVQSVTKSCTKKWSGKICYPYDLWEILSGYIPPESVGKFACLCKSAYLSIKRVSFWLKLHETYAVQVSNNAYRKKGKAILPDKFHSDYVNRFCQGNLRLLVIKSLFFTHEPFKKRLLSVHNQSDPHSVVGLLCVGSWTIKKASTYRFCFKVTSTEKKLSKINTGTTKR